MPISGPTILKFEILGRSLALQAEGDPALLERTVRLVEEKIREVRRELPRAANEELLLMVALNVAYEYLEIKEEWRQLQAEIARRSQQLIQMIDRQSSLPLRCS